MKLVFCGTPQFALPTLQALLHAGHSIELVVTQPDRVRGRDQAPSPPPVKVLALEAGLPIMQPEKIKSNAELRTRLEAIQPEAIIVVAYGRIIPDWMLQLPRWGNLNLHASLLPKYRGAAPIQWAIANGDTVTGATTMRIDQGLDTGDLLLQEPLAIEPDQTAEQLHPGRRTRSHVQAGNSAEQRRCFAGADSRTRRCAGRLPPFRAGDLQPLARLPALARGVRLFPQQKADAAPSHAGAGDRSPGLSWRVAGRGRPPVRGCGFFFLGGAARGAGGG
jgi:folate-dependent phosphoribosylglycinamide formyltransferase PurN